MPWLRLDDGFAEHEKVIGLSDAAFRLHVKTMCYCARRLTDGIVPYALVSRGERRLAQELMEAGVWEINGEGYEVHDFLDWNPSRADVEGSRDQARERMFGRRSPDVRANIDRTTTEGSEEVREKFAFPVPVPKPVTSSVPKHLRSSWEEFWTAYPRKVGKRTAATAFVRACDRTHPETIVEGAEKLAADPNLPELRFVPHPTTWLNRDGWLDAPHSSQSRSKVGNLLALAEKAEHD